MDIYNECIFLGIDLFALGLLVVRYVSQKRTVGALKSAPQYALDEDLRKTVSQQEDKRIPYAVIRGSVTPIGVPMRSVLAPSVTGVLQVIKLTEHRVTRGFAGFWREAQKLIHVSSNQMSFELRNKEVGVEIVDALSAAVLDMDVVYDDFEPISPTLIDHLVGFFTGVREKGLQTTEEVLRDGSFITAIGELELNGKTLRMQASKMGPLFLTTATKSTLIKKLDEAKNSTMVKIVVAGAISAILIGIIGRKIYRKRREQKFNKSLREAVENERRKHPRAHIRGAPMSFNNRCLICSSNPKEFITLPCGHVRLCPDCSYHTEIECPFCP